MVCSVSLSLPLLSKRMNATVYLKRNIDAHFQWYLVAVFRTKSTFKNVRGLAFTRTSRWHWCHMAFLSSTNFCIVILPKFWYLLFFFIVLSIPVCRFNRRISWWIGSAVTSWKRRICLVIIVHPPADDCRRSVVSSWHKQHFIQKVSHLSVEASGQANSFRHFKNQLLD